MVSDKEFYSGCKNNLVDTHPPTPQRFVFKARNLFSDYSSNPKEKGVMGFCLIRMSTFHPLPFLKAALYDIRVKYRKVQ